MISLSPLSLLVFLGFLWVPHEIQSALQFLFSRGFALEAVDSDQTRPLHLAARFGHSQAVAKLIGPGAWCLEKGETITIFMVIECDIMGNIMRIGEYNGNIMGM